MPRVLIGIPCLIHGGFRPFDVNLAHLVERTHARGSPSITIFYSMTGVLPGARNRIVREAIRIGADYIWMLDDDQPFDPGDDTRASDLEKLLTHNVDAVIPLSCRRGTPFLPLLFSEIEETGYIARQRYLQPGEDGLIRIAAAGLAGLLIKTACFAQLGADGWFEFVHPPDHPDNWSEDFPFYLKLAKANIPLYCDLNVRFGHAVTCVAYITKQQGQWVTVLADIEPFVAFPQQTHPLAPPAPRPHTKVLRSSVA